MKYQPPKTWYLQRRGHRGRSASYPTAPAQIPACGITAPGSLRKAQGRLQRYSPPAW